jgi:hypothetical protein
LHRRSIGSFTNRVSLDQHADHHVVGCRRRRRAFPRIDSRPREFAATAGAPSILGKTSSGAKLFDRVRTLNVETYCMRSQRYTHSVRPFAPRIPTPAATSRNSG